jgi:AcrR family transcriptional regulator
MNTALHVATAARANAPLPRRRTQAERVAESDRRMLDAAMRLIATRGYSLTTLESIGVEAGYSRGLVQHRFGSKDKLLEALIAKIAQAHRERLLPRLKGLTGLAALECEIDCYLEGMDDPPMHSRAFFVLMSEAIGPAQHVRHAFAEISARWHAALAGQIVKGQKAGEIQRDVDPKMEAQLLIAAVRGLRLQSMLAPGAGDIAAAIAALKRDLRRRLAARAS